MKFFRGTGEHSVLELEEMVIERNERINDLSDNQGAEDPRIKDLRWALEKLIVRSIPSSNVYLDAVRKFKTHFAEDKYPMLHQMEVPIRFRDK